MEGRAWTVRLGVQYFRGSDSVYIELDRNQHDIVERFGNWADGLEDKENLPYRSLLQPYGAWIALVAFVFLTLVNGFDVFFPGRFNASSFLTAYVGIPIFLGIYFGHKVFHWREPWAYAPENVDLYTGVDIVIANETPEVHAKTWKKKKLQGWFT